jgi:Zn-dependent protease with chaperone function
MSATLPEDQRLANLSSKAFEHPADRAATAALQSIPMLDVVVRKLIEFGYERALRQQFLAASVRLGEDQLPAVWADWNAACARLDLPERYDLYLTQFPVTNAAAVGAGTPMVIVNSRCLDLLDELELRTVLGHEAGHILSDHVLYRTALMILLQLSSAAKLPVIAGLPLMAVQLALLEWYRAAELSADRAATLVNRDPLVTCRTMMVLAGGVAARRLDLDAFIRQAGDYEEWSSGWDKLNRLRSELTLTHSYPVRRVKEVMAWVRSGDYDRIVAGDYRTRDQPADPRKEAGEAADHYKERFRGIFNEFGGERAHEKVSDVAYKVGDWLKTGRGGSDAA